MSSRVKTYVIGFATSVILTLAAFTLVAAGTLPVSSIMILIVLLAVVQLIVQLIFFLHIGSGKDARWKLATFAFAVIIIVILVGGSVWIMSTLNYNMMHMSQPDQELYLQHHEGI